MWFWCAQVWHLECSECFDRKGIRQHRVWDVKLSGLETVPWLRVMQDRGHGLAGLTGPARQGELVVVWAQPIAQESIRRQMIVFAYHRELGPIHTALDHILGLTMCLLACESD